jgi:hypothetical protein
MAKERRGKEKGACGIGLRDVHTHTPTHTHTDTDTDTAKLRLGHAESSPLRQTRLHPLTFLLTQSDLPGSLRPPRRTHADTSLRSSATPTPTLSRISRANTLHDPELHQNQPIKNSPNPFKPLHFLSSLNLYSVDTASTSRSLGQKNRTRHHPVTTTTRTPVPTATRRFAPRPKPLRCARNPLGLRWPSPRRIFPLVLPYPIQPHWLTQHLSTDPQHSPTLSPTSTRTDADTSSCHLIRRWRTCR